MESLFENQSLEKLIDKPSERLYAQVVDRIRQWIIEGRFREGDALPSERELAKILGVSRMPIREALKVLEFVGVVQQIRGVGVVVKRISIMQVLNNLDFVMLDPSHALQDIFEMREAIENQAARLAAQRRTKEDLDAMEDALLEMERNILMNKDIDITSLKFHSAVIVATHNDLMVKVNEFLMDLFKYSRKESLNDSSRYKIILDEHKQIFQDIKEQDQDRAALTMGIHVHNFHSR